MEEQERQSDGHEFFVQGRECFFGKVLESSLNGIYVYDLAKQTHAFINPQYAVLTGYTLDDLQKVRGDGFFELFHPDDVEKVAAHIERVRRSGEDRTFEIEYRFRRADGRWMWYLSRDTVFARDDAGEVRQIIGTFIDINERKEHEWHHARNLRTAQRLVEISQEVLAAEDLETVLQKVVDAGRELTSAKVATSGHALVDGQFNVAAISKMPGVQACPPGEEFKTAAGGVYQEIIRTPEAIRLTDEQMRSHPSWRGLPEGHLPLRGLLGARLVDPRGRGNGLIMVSDKVAGEFTAEDAAVLQQLANVTSLAIHLLEARDRERKRAEEAIEAGRAAAQSEELAQHRLSEIEAIYDSAHVGLCVFDREMRFLRVNERLAEINGAAAADHIGRTVREIVPDLAEEAERLGNEVLRTGRPVLNVEVSGTTPARPGVQRDWIEHWMPLQDEGGEIIGINVVAEEVTEAKRMQRSLAESEARHRATFENAAVGMARVGRSGRFLRVNERLCEITGYNENELMNLSFQDITHPDDLETDLAQARLLWEGKIEHYRMEKRYIHKDSRAVWVNLTCSVQRDADGKPHCGIAVVEDISVRKSVQNALRASELRMRAILEHLPVGVWFADEEGQIIYCNATAQRIWEGARFVGVEHVDVYKGWWYDTGETIEAEDWAIVRAVQRGETSINETIEIECFDGTHKIIRNSAVPMRTEDGEIVGAVVLNEDITDQIRAAEALEASEKQLRELAEGLEEQVAHRTEELARTVNQLQDEVEHRKHTEATLQEHSRMLEGFFTSTITPLAFMDRDFNFIRVNNAYAAADGKTPGDLAGKNHFDLYPHAENEVIFRQVVETKEPYVATARPFAYKDDPTRTTYWNWQITPILDNAGEVASLVLNLEDVTERQVALQQLAERAEQLRRMSQELSEAEDRERRRLAEVLHDDLQQMLVGAKLQLGIVERKSRDDEGLVQVLSEVQELLRESVQKCRALSHELCPPALYDGGLAEGLKWLSKQMRTTCGLTVQVDCDPRANVHSDAVKAFLYKSAQELLFNVVKHSRVKEASLRLRCIRDGIALSVRDQGKGFDPEAIIEDAHGGFGLFTIRERAELLGGSLKIDSAEGEGSRFTVQISALPDTSTKEARRVRKAAKRKKSATGKSKRRKRSGRRLRVLLVDDHSVMRAGVEALLDDEADLEAVGQAGNGRDAITLAGRLKPDVILMDVEMPILDGAAATRTIKERWPETRIVALSMFENEAIRNRMREAGADAYVSKNDPSETLLAAIRDE